jgi:hypothetical protein
MNYALIEKGKVTAVIVWDGKTPYGTQAEKIALPEGSPVGPDWDYIDGEFVDNRPAYEPEEQIMDENPEIDSD